MTTFRAWLFSKMFDEADQVAIINALWRRSEDDNGLITEDDKAGRSDISMQNAVLKLRCKLLAMELG